MQWIEVYGQEVSWDRSEVCDMHAIHCRDMVVYHPYPPMTTLILLTLR